MPTTTQATAHRRFDLATLKTAPGRALGEYMNECLDGTARYDRERERSRYLSPSAIRAAGRAIWPANVLERVNNGHGVRNAVMAVYRDAIDALVELPRVLLDHNLNSDDRAAAVNEAAGAQDFLEAAAETGFVSGAPIPAAWLSRR